MALLPPNPVLQPLQVLIGDWTVEVPQFPEAQGRATFEWLEGGAYFRLHTEAPDPAPWKIWRDVPGFFQRFSGTVSEDGSSIRASWEKSPDGSAWEHDFDLIYTRV
jgi:hypothetical protein